MKCISLWQPWATAIALGSKRIETRGWSTKYRGRIAIHAAKKKELVQLMYAMSTWEWCGALGRLMGDNTRLWDTMPFGSIVATAQLVDVRPVIEIPETLLDMPRRPLWVLMDVQPLARPVSYRGLQGLFNVPDDVLCAGAPAAETFVLASP